jgi:hypothetical protein
LAERAKWRNAAPSEELIKAQFSLWMVHTKAAKAIKRK